MATHRDHHRLPQLDGDVFLADGGIETSLIYGDGLELPDFAAFHLLATDAGTTALRRYFETYAEIARRHQVGIVLETPTWRASADWGARLGYTTEELAAVNRRAVALVDGVRRATPEVPVVVSGCVGPRGDGYVVGEVMSVEEARRYHALQVRTFASGAADMVGAITMTYVEEAIGVTLAAEAAGMPVQVSFTVETDGRLPAGQPLGEAIQAVDEATGAYPAYYMVNCAHPTHFAHVLDGPWTARLRGVRANASTMSHAELDAAEDLDAGDPDDLAARYVDLGRALPGLAVAGGCCGTDHRHIEAIAAALAASTPAPA